MTELDKLKQLLDKACIEYETVNKKVLMLKTKPFFANELPDGLYLIGWGFSAIWPYSAEFVAKMLDRKFREEMGGAA